MPIWSWVLHIFDYAVVYPLRLFYQHGPIWKGASLPDVCAQITRVDASFWAEQPLQCKLMFERQFTSFSTGIGVTLYFSCILIGIVYMVCRCCFLRPMASEIARAFKNNIKSQKKDVLPVNSRPCGHTHCCRCAVIKQT